MSELDAGSSPGEKGEFLSLFLAVEADLYRYVCALVPKPSDARDVVQDTALALWQSFSQYDRRRPFLPWALRFALNKARQHAARVTRHPLLTDDEGLAGLVLEEQEAQQPLFEERRGRLFQCLEKLQPEQAGLARKFGVATDKFGNSDGVLGL